MKLFLTVLFLILLLSTTAYSQWDPDPTINNPVCTENRNQTQPQIASDGANGSIIVWQDERDSSTNGCDIYAQRLDANGNRLWALNGVPICTAPDDQIEPHICSDDSGGAIIVWTDKRFRAQYLPATSAIFAQRVRPDGTLGWSVNGVSVDEGSDSTRINSAITIDGAHGVVIAWVQNEHNVAGTNDIHATRLNASGDHIWPPIPVCAEIKDQVSPQIVNDLSQGAVISWIDYRNSALPSNTDIYAQRLNGAGSAVWALNGVPLSTLAGDQLQLRMTSDDNSGAIVTYVNPAIGDDNTIYAQRVTLDGTLPWAPASTGGVDLHGSFFLGFFSQPAITQDGDEGAIIAFSECCFLGIEAQRISKNGMRLWTDNGIVVANAANDEISPAIVPDGTGGAIVTWQDTRAALTNKDLYAQRIDKDGGTLWLDNGLALSTNISAQGAPVAVFAGLGGIIAAWEDDRNAGTTLDIYCNFVRPIVSTAHFYGLPGHYQFDTGLSLDFTDVDPPGTEFDFRVAKYNVAPTDPEYDHQGIQKITVRAFEKLHPLTQPHPPVRFHADMRINFDLAADFDIATPLHKLRVATRPDSGGPFKISEFGIHLPPDVDHIILSGVSHFSEWVLAEATDAVVAFEVKTGWNLLSLSVSVADYSKQALFPTAATAAFAYTGVYVQKGTLANGDAYWIKFQSDEQIQMTGGDIKSVAASVHPGWNLIGSVSVPIAVSSITSSPPGLVVSNFFGYSGVYVVADSIFPARGYWVKVNGSGTLNLSSVPGTQIMSRIRIFPSEDLPPSPPATDVASAPTIPTEYRLKQNYPNPFNPTTTLNYLLHTESKVRLTISNVLGQIVATLVDGIEDAGYKSATWNATGAASGVYDYRLEATPTSDPSKTFSQVRKMMLVK